MYIPGVFFVKTHLLTNADLPSIYNALTMKNGQKTLTVEVAQHIGDNTARCIAMSSTDGLKIGTPVTDTGSPISVPVGRGTLGRIFNVLGDVVDNKPFEDELFNNITKPTRKNIKKTLKLGLVMEEIGIEGLEEYKRITEHTGNRRGFIDRPLSYYQEMFDVLGDKMSIILCYLNIDKSISIMQEEIDQY